MNSCTESPQPRLRILALHGKGSNQYITRLQLENLGVSDAKHQIVYAEGPISEPNPGPGLNELSTLANASWYSWFHAIPESQVDARNIADRKAILSAIAFILDIEREQGPFDAVFGFSQGCIIASLVNELSVSEALCLALESHTGKSYSYLNQSAPLFPAAVFACAAGPGDLETLRTQLGIPVKLVCSPSYRSVHLIGKFDALKAWSESFAVLMNAKNTSVVYFDGAHEISQYQRDDSYLIESVRACLLGSGDDHNSRLPPLTWRHSSDRSSRAIDPSFQIATVQARTNDLPDTILGMLSAQAPQTPLFRHARERNAARNTTYGQMLAFCLPGGDGDLRRLGVTKGEVLAYLAPVGGSATAAAAFLSIASQAVAVPFSPSMTESDALIALKQYDVSHMVLFEGVFSPGVRSAFEKFAATGHARLHRANDTSSSLPGLFQYEATETPFALLPPLANPATAICLLLRTSGTTSLPKVVPLRQSDLVLNAALLADGLGINSEDVTYSVMPLDHIGGLSASILCSVAVGAAITCDGSYTPQGMVEALSVSNPRPTWYSAVPTIHNATVRYLQDSGLIDADGTWPDHGLRMIRSGAAALKEPDRKALEQAYACEVVSTYSMSEQMPISQPPRTGGTWLQQADGVGVPVIASMAVVEPSTLRPIPYGSVGEVAISGPTVFSGYVNNPEANRDSRFLLRSENGLLQTWFLTGDLGTLDNDGTLTLNGRLKELIKRGGEQVSPVEIESLLVQHPWVSTAVCFSVPSDVYGEEVGCAVVLKSQSSGQINESEVIRELRTFMRQSGLASYKIPSHVKLVTDDQLPKTASRKYIRKGLAEVLAVTASTDLAAAPALTTAKSTIPSSLLTDKPKVDWSTLAGFRFLLACYVMFMHIGSDVSWGAFSNLRQFPWHVHSFFAVAGFSLVAFMPSVIQQKGAFIWARISGMYPLYALALLLCLINLFPSCQPSTFDPIFHWNSQPGDVGRMFCEGTPLIQDSWIGNLLSTLAIYLTGLSATPLWSAAWFMGFYLWFISMYFQCLIAFPFIYNALYKNRGNKTRLLLLTILGLAVNLAIVLTFWYGYAVDATGYGFFDQLTGEKLTPTLHQAEVADKDNAVILGFYLFAPFWMVYFVAGMCAAFLYDAIRPAESKNAHIWGRIADSITLIMILVSIAHVAQGYFPHGADLTKVSLESFFMRPDAADTFADPAVVNRIWDNIYARLFAPITLLWIFCLSTGQGVTARLLRSHPISQTLAPAAYGCFLFHQVVGQWYYALTRHGEWWNWWSYRKAFYWFSPQPVPVEWYEYFYVVGIVVLFAKAVQPLEPVLKHGLAALGGLILGRSNAVDVSEKDTLVWILEIIQKETGMEAQAEWHLEECGLASLGIVRFVATLEREFLAGGREITLQAGEIMAAINIREIANIVDAARSGSLIQANLQPT